MIKPTADRGQFRIYKIWLKLHKQKLNGKFSCKISKPEILWPGWIGFSITKE